MRTKRSGLPPSQAQERQQVQTNHNQLSQAVEVYPDSARDPQPQVDNQISMGEEELVLARSECTYDFRLLNYSGNPLEKLIFQK